MRPDRTLTERVTKPKGCAMKLRNKDTPQWAIDLVTEVCAKHNRQKPGTFTWGNANNIYSSGKCRYSRRRNGTQIKIWTRLKNGKMKMKPFYGEIIVKAGLSQFDQKLVLLHELAHWVSYRNTSKGHTVKFWKKAFELYRDYGLDMDKAYKREQSYKKFATVVYERHFKTT